MNKLLALFLAALMIVGIMAGCSNDTPADKPQPKPTAAPTEPPEPVRNEELWFQNGEKKIYAQMFLPMEEKDQYPVVVISHGYNGSYTDNVSRAELFARNGYVAVVFDFCGGGRRSKSDGEITEMSVLTEAADLNAVIDGLLAFDYIDSSNLFLLGASQGGFISAYVAAQRPDDIKALSLLFPAFALQDDCWDRHGSIDNIPETESFMNVTLGAIFSQDAMSFDIYDVIGGYTGPVLICHGDKDDIVDLSYAERAITVYAQAELKVLKGAGHGFRDKHLEESNGYLVDFLLAHTN